MLLPENDGVPVTVTLDVGETVSVKLASPSTATNAPREIELPRNPVTREATESSTSRTRPAVTAGDSPATNSIVKSSLSRTAGCPAAVGTTGIRRICKSSASPSPSKSITVPTPAPGVGAPIVRDGELVVIVTPAGRLTRTSLPIARAASGTLVSANAASQSLGDLRGGNPRPARRIDHRSAANRPAAFG